IACDPLMQHIFTLFLIISFELKKGAIHENDIPDLFSLSYLIRKTNETKSNVELIKGKYSIFKTYAFHPVAKEIWTELFRTGTTDKDELNQQLFDSSYLASNTTPAWQQLYYFENLEDERFIHVQNAVYEELVGNKFTNPYFVIQAVGILIFLSQAKLNNHSVEHLIGLGKLNLDILKKKGHLNRMELKKFPGDHSHGLGYAAKGVSAYDDFLKYCAEFATQAEKDEWPKRARVLLSDLKKSPKRFCSKIDNDSPNGMAFVQIPILTYIEPETFVEEILLMPNSDKRLILDSLESRYKYGSITELSLEAKWLKSIITNLEQKAEYLKGTLAGYLIFSKIIPSFKSHLSRLPQSEI
ncbi:MAG: hypothetical protein JST50_14660, partial [Bacteroidetes bacterium]|nr:hypothetical protein [Bacteroidota bacterium]